MLSLSVVSFQGDNSVCRFKSRPYLAPSSCPDKPCSQLQPSSLLSPQIFQDQEREQKQKETTYTYPPPQILGPSVGCGSHVARSDIKYLMRQPYVMNVVLMFPLFFFVTRPLLVAVPLPPPHRRTILTQLPSSLVQELPPLELQDLVPELDPSLVPSSSDMPVTPH